MADASCFIAFPGICATYSIDIPVWELLIVTGVSVAATLVSVIVTAVVTAVTIVAATSSAQKATAASLEQAAVHHREALSQSAEHHDEAIDAAERENRYQDRVRDATTLGQLVRDFYDAVLEEGDPLGDRAFQKEYREVESAIAPSLSPLAPDLLRVLRFEMEVTPLASDLTAGDADAFDAWREEVLRRREDALDSISAWARDPDDVALTILNKAKRIGAVDLMGVAFGGLTQDVRDLLVRSDPPSR